MAKREKRKRIAIASGGTGGHMFPALALAELMMKGGYKILFITDRNFDKFAANFAAVKDNPDFAVYYIGIKRRSGVRGRMMMALEAFLSVFPLMARLIKSKSEAVVGFGSYVSLPAIVAGFLARRRTILHEQNSVMGLSNKMASLFVTVCACGFLETKGLNYFASRKAIFVGNPIRDDFVKLYDDRHDVDEYTSVFKLSGFVNLLVLGGSQGSRVFKDIISEAVCGLPLKIRRKLRVYQQANADQVAEIEALYAGSGVAAAVAPFFNNVPELMGLSHLFIGRAGASTIAEITCMGVPSLLIPYPNAAHNHQMHNALFLQKQGGAVVIAQKDANPRKLAKAMEALLLSDQELLNMSQKAKELAQPFATVKMATMVETVVFGKSMTRFGLSPLHDRLARMKG